jgi:hypothetical protein
MLVSTEKENMPSKQFNPPCLGIICLFELLSRQTCLTRQAAIPGVHF